MPRLDQLLARNLGISRREVTLILRRGMVESPNGDRLRDGRARIELPTVVRVRGELLELREHVHLMQHKPVGVVSSRSDPLHPTAWDLLAVAPMHDRLVAVGRLDLDAAGLLLWTTDGSRVHALTHPRRGVPRTYQVALARAWSNPEGEVRLADGFVPRIVSLDELDDAQRHPALEPPEGTRALATITVLDGAHHEVKRIFAALDSHVLRLARVSHAAIELPHDLPAGGWRELPAI